MSSEMALMQAFLIISNGTMYLTLPLHIRLLYVLIFPSKNIKLDKSFHTLMIHTTIGNLIFSIIYCLSQGPAGAGLFYDLYVTIGPVVGRIEHIKSSSVLLFTTCLHLVLAASRFTAIAFPIKHPKIWVRVPYLCAVLWILSFLIAIPLMLPGSTRQFTIINAFGLPSLGYSFNLNYFMIYTVIGSFFATVVETLTICFYIAMIAKFHQFRKFTKSNASEVRRMTRGVARTTVAAVTTSMGSWIIVAFFVTVTSYSYSTGGKQLFDGVRFFSIFSLLNAINNVLTPWVLLIAFPNVRSMILFNLIPRREATSGEMQSEVSIMKKKSKTAVTTSKTRTVCF